MSERSYVPWNIAGIATAIIGFAIGSIKGPMSGGGLHTTIGAIIGLSGAAVAVAAFVAERRKARRR